MAIVTDLNINDTGYLKMPSGTTAQRPSSPQVGMFRHNTDFDVYEVYTPNGWKSNYGKSVANPANSAREIYDNYPVSQSGFYYLKGVNDIPYLTFCDMVGNMAGSSVGGWALFNRFVVQRYIIVDETAVVDTPKYYVSGSNGVYIRTTAADSVISGVKWDFGPNINFEGIRITYVGLDLFNDPDGNGNDIAQSRPNTSDILNFATSTIDLGSNVARFGFAASNGVDVVKLYSGGEFPPVGSFYAQLSSASFSGNGDNNMTNGNGRYVYWYFSDGSSEYYTLDNYIIWLR